MTQKYWEHKPTSFQATVEHVERFIRAEIIRETKEKQLYYHNIDHALGVKRRAELIFEAIAPVLAQNFSALELSRIASLISVSSLAHDMVQIFEPTPPNHSRKRLSGSSEAETAHKLLAYIQKLNRALVAERADPFLLFSDREQLIIKDSILATICVPDPVENQADFAFSARSIYQPYLYDSQTKISLVGSIIALADLGTLGIDGVEAYINDGILIFLEDNPHLATIASQCNPVNCSQEMVSKAKLLGMSRFIVDLAYERKVRFEREIEGFEPQIRHILRTQVFVHLNQSSIERVRAIVPHEPNTSFKELIDFFCSNTVRVL